MRNESLENYLQETQQELLTLTYRLCEIPAPSHHEEKRAEFCRNWLAENGIEGAYIDKALNVIWKYGDAEPFAAVAAHLDTVFPETEPFTVKQNGNIVSCPAIGDDTINVAGLMLLMRYFAKYRPQTENGMLFVLNSCEEGLGNLKGVRQLFADFDGRIGEFLSLDGGTGSVTMKAVGSHRYRVTIETEGGHSFGAFGNRNAIERAARMIARLYAVTVPSFDGARTTYNVGTISGGTSVNTIAQEVEFLYEYRSDSYKCLDAMKKIFSDIAQQSVPECSRIKVELLGERPCGIVPDTQRTEALYDRVNAAAKSVFHGPDLGISAGSTDCNIPLSLGVPAACFGIGGGVGAHTYEEYLCLDNVPKGYTFVGRVLGSYIC